MFTGLIESLGVVNSVYKENLSLVITLTPLKENFFVNEGDSVAVNGVCLTAEKILGRKIVFRAVKETVEKTTMKNLKNGEEVNLERAMPVNGRLDGHIVQGHCDGIAKIVKDVTAGDSVYRTFEPDKSLLPFIAKKGSIAIDGISLTVSDTKDNFFTVSFIPYTLNHTNMKNKNIGDYVNIECDVVSRYIFRLIEKSEFLNVNLKRLSDDNIMNLLERGGF